MQVGVQIVNQVVVGGRGEDTDPRAGDQLSKIEGQSLSQSPVQQGGKLVGEDERSLTGFGRCQGISQPESIALAIGELGRSTEEKASFGQAAGSESVQSLADRARERFNKRLVGQRQRLGVESAELGPGGSQE